MKKFLLILGSIPIISNLSAGDQAAATAKSDKVILETLEFHCYDCHNSKKREGDVRLDNFEDLSKLDKFELLNRIEEQVYLNNMPPKDEKIRPTPAERTAFFDAITSHHKVVGSRSSFREKLNKPQFANYLDHEKLFSGEYKHLEGFTYNRKWLLSEYIFDDKVSNITGHQTVRGGRWINGKNQGYIRGTAVPLGNPFLLSDDQSVQYFADETINSSHFLTLMDNASLISGQIMRDAARGDTEYKAIRELMAFERDQRAILGKWSQFTKSHIHELCRGIYGDKNEEYLPEFTPEDLSFAADHIAKIREEYKKAKPGNGRGGHKGNVFDANNPGKSSRTLYRALIKVAPESKTDEELWYNAEKLMFHMGETAAERKKLMIFMKSLHGHIMGKYKRLRGYKKYEPLSPGEMKVINRTILKHRKKGMKYNEIAQKCISEWHSLYRKQVNQQPDPNPELLTKLIHQLYRKFYENSPSNDEITNGIDALQGYMKALGRSEGIKKYIETLMISSEFVNRNEYGSGETDEYGRKRLSPWAASFALAYALTDSSPDDELKKAAREGRLSTKEDYAREVSRMLKDRSNWYIIDKRLEGEIMYTGNITKTPIRKLRFFRDFFGYPKMLDIFKDDSRFGGRLELAQPRLVAEADIWVDHIITKDKNVFDELLTSEEFFYYHTGDNEYMKSFSENIRQFYLHFKDEVGNIKTNKDLLKHKKILAKLELPGVSVKDLEKNKDSKNSASLKHFHLLLKDLIPRYSHGQDYAFPYLRTGGKGRANKQIRPQHPRGGVKGRQVVKFWGIHGSGPYSPIQPVKIPNRKGILTHPAWLIAHSQNQHTDPVIRGKWIRENLLAGTVPDVPITVDAVIPQDPHRTLRQRLATVTEEKSCWKCHVDMNPLGYPFEMYDDFGRYRTEEKLEHAESAGKTLPVNTKGYLKGTGNPQLDGEVTDAIDLIERIAKAEKTRQSIIRHAFRYFMGRNEMLSDSKTLIDADQAYVKSGGSFDAVIVSLLSSDSFIYRKEYPKQ